FSSLPLALPFPFFVFSFYCSLPLRYLLSFPTRRSSDLFFLLLFQQLLKNIPYISYSFYKFHHLTLQLYNLLFHVLLAHLAKFLRSEEHTSELQSRFDLVCRLLLEKKKQTLRKAT